MAAHRAFADDGPLGGNLNLTVDRGEHREWPREVVWTTGPGDDERHVYRFLTVAVGTAGGVPMYRFVRTLEVDEQQPL